MNESGRAHASPRSFCRIARAMIVTFESNDTVTRTGPAPVAATDFSK